MRLNTQEDIFSLKTIERSNQSSACSSSLNFSSNKKLS